MPGLYVHIPFCARRCPYCDFAVSVDKRADFRARYVVALQLELANELKKLKLPLETLFFGGGTPTELPAATLIGILAPALNHAASGAEVSLEANPENLDFEALQTLRRGGFNRISLGAQSFDDRELRVLGRAHNAEKIEEVVVEAKRAGFENLSLDLIYGTPLSGASGASVASWKRGLERAIALELTHISAYCLTIESGTAFGKRVERGQMSAPDADLTADLMDETAQTLEAAGFERYEVSNWAKPGFESLHNRNYWRGGDYLGVGCGAHGHKSGHRFWNERDARIYVARIEKVGQARAGEEYLTARERAIEIVALGTRQREGFDLDAVSKSLSFEARAALNASLDLFVSQGMLCDQAGRIYPAPHALALADGLAARLVAHF